MDSLIRDLTGATSANDRIGMAARVAPLTNALLKNFLREGLIVFFVNDSSYH